ncbi:MAG: hypothetical protein MZW92_52115 [Comamonadaceae bacterium]|nr:hypothetical protein [Comamonadaceae bacterium]
MVRRRARARLPAGGGRDAARAAGRLAGGRGRRCSARSARRSAWLLGHARWRSAALSAARRRPRRRASSPARGRNCAFDPVGAAAVLRCSASPRRSAAALVPALEAAAAPPALALKAGDEARSLARAGSRLARRCAARRGAGAWLRCRRWTGCRCSATPPSPLLLVGAILLMPRLRAPAFAALPRRARARRCSCAQAAAAQRARPSRRSACAAILASVAVAAAMAIMVASLPRLARRAGSTQVLPADLYARAGRRRRSALPRCRPQQAIAARHARRGAACDFVRHQNLLLDAGRAAGRAARAQPGRRRPGRSVLPLVGAAARRRAATCRRSGSSEAMVDLYGCDLGSVVAAAAGRAQPSASSWPASGATTRASTARWRCDVEVYRRADRRRRGSTTSAVWLAPGARPPTRGRRAARSASSGGERLEIATPGEIRAAEPAALRPHASP